MIAVVGAGIMGLATAWALVRRGHDVVVLEQFELGHRRGSSHGTSRIFRLSYPEAEWVALAQDAWRGWRELERQAGEAILRLGGLVEAVRDIEARARALRERGVDFEVLIGAEARERFGLTYADDVQLLFQPDAGIARADVAQHALRVAAEAGGASIRERAPVSRLEPAAHRVLVHGPVTVSADAVVVTAGGWVRALAGPLGIDVPVTVTRETVAYFALRPGWSPPSVIDDLDEHGAGESLYALAAPGAGLKAGVHCAGEPADPDERGSPDERLVEQATEWVRRRFSAVEPAPLRAETCLYTNAPEHRFLLERHGRVVVGSACSGHGFKFAPAVGERLADLAEAAVAG